MSRRDWWLRTQRIQEVREQFADISPDLRRPGENRVKVWILLGGSRQRVALAFLTAIFSLLFLSSMVNPVAMASLVTEQETMQLLFRTFLSATVVLVSIVVSLTSIMLSQELVPLSQQQERVEASQEFWNQLQDLVSLEEESMNPAGFLHALLQNVLSQADTLKKTAAASENRQYQKEVNRYVREDVTSQIKMINRELTRPPTTMLDVLIAGLSYNYSRQIEIAQYLQNAFDSVISDADEAAFEELVETLQVFAVGHQYFKTLYYRQEFSNLSRDLLYITLPLILFASYTMLALDAGLIPNVTVLGVHPLIVFTSLIYTVLLTPFVILTVYILRVVTLTKRTLTAGPLHVQVNAASVDWEQIQLLDDYQDTPDRTRDRQ